MAKKNTLNDLNEFLKETQDTTEVKVGDTKSKEEFLATKPSQLVDVKKTAETTKKTPATKKTTTVRKRTTKTAATKAKTTTQKTTGKKTAAKSTPKKTNTKSAATRTRAKASTTKKTAPNKAAEVAITEESILKQLDALAQKEGKTMREIWENIAKRIGAEKDEQASVTDEVIDSVVDIAMAPMNFLVSVSDRINKML